MVRTDVVPTAMTGRPSVFASLMRAAVSAGISMSS